ncbi:hypothetical protein [Salmonella phage NINP13076]|uniref:Uncharacterized protein n=1 Tax=Salmonella phage SalP219 TaxID=3158864 RepID=A0AAU7PKI9_9CAUD|nr:hypothetical protein [Salmonella phage NINP13076]
MYENILGRPATAPEQRMLDHGFKPAIVVGEDVMIIDEAHSGKVDAVVLFAVPPTPYEPRPKLAWGFRVEGRYYFLEEKELIRIQK